MFQTHIARPEATTTTRLKGMESKQDITPLAPEGGDETFRRWSLAEEEWVLKFYCSAPLPVFFFVTMDSMQLEVPCS